MRDHHAFVTATDPRKAGTCARCGLPERHLRHEVKRAYVHPLDRERANAALERLKLPVQETTLCPRGKIWVVDPSEMPDIGDLDVSS